MVRNSLELADAPPIRHNLEYVPFLCPFNLLHLLTLLELWRKEIQFVGQFCASLYAALFVNWQYVNNLGLLTRDQQKYLVCVPSWWSDY